jgi:xanthine dehydrogenase accessory factor
MRDLLQDYETLMAAGDPVGRAVVTSVWGSAPRAEGACMLATRGGKVAGSVSGGCVESAVAEEIGIAIGAGTPKLVTIGVSHERAWEVGLACGGTIKVFVEPTVRSPILAAARGAGGVVVATVTELSDPALPGIAVGATAVVRENGTTEHSGWPRWLLDGIGEPAGGALRAEASATVELARPDGGRASVFLEVFARRPKLVIFGAVHIAMALVPMARMLGYYTVVADGRQTFLNRERFPDADELLLAWPEEAFRQTGLDPGTYVCLLSHDPKFDEPAMELALRSPAVYIGAIGSRKTQAARRERLLAQGFSATDVARVHGPIGLELGGRAPAETALAILAQMTAVRYGKGREAPFSPPRLTPAPHPPTARTGSAAAHPAAADTPRAAPGGGSCD